MFVPCPPPLSGPCIPICYFLKENDIWGGNPSVSNNSDLNMSPAEAWTSMSNHRECLAPFKAHLASIPPPLLIISLNSSPKSSILFVTLEWFAGQSPLTWWRVGVRALVMPQEISSHYRSGRGVFPSQNMLSRTLWPLFKFSEQDSHADQRDVKSTKCNPYPKKHPWLSPLQLSRVIAW